MGEGRRPEIVLTPAENLLQNFISSARRRWGWGRARRMDVVGETGTCMVMNAAAPKAALPSPPPHPEGCKLSPCLPLCFWPHRIPVWVRDGADGVKVKESRSRLGTLDWLSLPHTMVTRRPHGRFTAPLGVGVVVPPTVQRRKLRYRTGLGPVTQPAHNTQQGCGQKLGGPAWSPHFFSLPLPHSSQALPSHFWLCDQVGACGATRGGTGSSRRVHPPDMLRQPGCVQVHAHKAQPGWEQGTGLVPVRFPRHT